MNNTLMSAENWSQLLKDSFIQHEHIFYDKKNDQFYLRSELRQVSHTDSKIQELDINQLIDFSIKIVEQTENHNKKADILDILHELIKHTEQKYFSRFGKIAKVFNRTCNAFAGKGFHQTTKQALKKISSVRQLKDFSLCEERAPSAETLNFYAEEEEVYHLISSKEILGKGKHGKVYSYKNNAKIAIKKSEMDMKEEYEIGVQLNHPYIVKVHDLVIEESLFKIKYKMSMDKIAGFSLSKYYQGIEPVLSNQIVQTLITQARDTCLYLFDQKIYWGDVNDGNIFVTIDNNLMLCDLGAWGREENSKTLAFLLILGSMEIIGWIIKSSKLRENGQKNRVLERSIIFPQSFFDEQIKSNQMISIFMKVYETTKWGKKITIKLAEMNNTEIEDFLTDYFNQVLKAFINRPLSSLIMVK